jgi:hypothetical protein
MHRAVWLPLLLLGVPLALGVAALDAWLAHAAGPLRWAAAAFVLIALLLLLSVALWCVGAWRSAAAWLAGGLEPWVAWVSRGIVALLAVLAIGWLASLVAARGEQTLGLLFGHDAAGTLEIAPSADGRALHLGGRIGDSDAQRITQALERLPGLRRLELAVAGGRLGEAASAAQPIAVRRLQTTALGPCGNACAVLLAAGTTRMATPEGRPTFVRESPGRFNGWMQPLVDRLARGAFTQAGLDLRLVDGLLKTPRGLRWQPDTDELEAAGLLSAPPRPLDALLPTAEDAPAADYALALRARPAWAAAGQRQPGLLGDAAARMHAERTTSDEAGVQLAAQSLLPRLWATWLATSSDELRQQHLTLLLEQMAAFPTRCADLLAGDAAALRALPLALAHKEAAWLADLAREMPDPSPRRGLTALEREVLQRALGVAAAALAQGAWRTATSTVPGCERVRALIHDVLALPPGERRLASRAMFGPR